MLFSHALLRFGFFFPIYFSVRAVNSREGILKIKDYPLNDPPPPPPPIFVWLVVSTRILLAKVVYIVLGSS